MPEEKHWLVVPYLFTSIDFIIFISILLQVSSFHILLSQGIVNALQRGIPTPGRVIMTPARVAALTSCATYKT